MKLSRSVTTLFMVRPLGLSIEEIEIHGFINAYVSDINQDYQYENCVYLLFKPLDIDTFANFLDLEKMRATVVDDYDYEGGYIVVVYQYDSKHISNINLIKQGLYSKTDKQFQDLFPKVVKILKNGKHRDEISLQYRIFNRTQDLVNFWEDNLGIRFSQDQEAWEGFHSERETLNINNIKKDGQSRVRN
jgi:hypothetical protein